MAKKAQFATKIGLVAATVGSAIGLGNVWRFPAETQQNGGAAFLLLYIICVFILGIPVMLGEFSLGRGGQSDSVGVFRRLSPGSKWWIFGALGILASYLITIFYMVVAGWTLEYLVQSVSGSLYAGGTDGGGHDHFTAVMQRSVSGLWQPVTATLAIIVINILILTRGVQKGIERLSNVLMPMLFLILLGLFAVAMTLPGAGEGLEFFLKPDFAKITPSTVVNALGQTFFSLSLGMGILVTYSSYYPADTNLTKTSVTVALLSLMVALLMGGLIFPAVMSFGLQGESMHGATLIFVTLPEVFGRLPLPWLWSALFFLLLLVAAITSTVSLAEVTVAFLADRFGMARRRAVLVTLIPMLPLSSICALSMGPLSDITVAGLNFFDLLDTFATNILLPVVSIGTCLYVGWFGPKNLLSRQLTNNGTLRSPLSPAVIFILRWVAPLLIAAILILS
ncbi:MAG: sodium-dependent transporter [Bacteroidales bacterium]|nr:sodium-dependent transporter [Bacteroidales bacterium]